KKPARRLTNYLTQCDFDTRTEQKAKAVGWLDDQRAKAELEAHRERVRQVFSRSFGKAMKSSEWAQALAYVEGAKTIPDLQAVCRAFDIEWKDTGDMVTKDV